jgi:hypothetical protein
MALFKRKKKDSVLPEEVRDYYTAEKRDRKGMAWLLAIATLIVTFLIAAALFFGGRWVYRTVFDNDNKDNKTTSQEESGDKTAQDEAMELGDKKSSGNSNSSTGNSSSSSNGTPGSSTGTSSTNTPQTPVTGPSELVNTGPGDE